MEAPVARFAAPVAAAYAGFAALLSIFYYHVQLFRPWLIGGHVIVCGLGCKGRSWCSSCGPGASAWL